LKHPVDYYKYFASLPIRRNESEITCEIIRLKLHCSLAKWCFHKPHCSCCYHASAVDKNAILI